MKRHQNIFVIVSVYFLVLSIFTVYRGVLFLTELERIDFDQSIFTTIIQSFIMGIRFDTVISSYILLLPAFVLSIVEIFHFKSKIIWKILFYWIFVLFTITFMISAVDIPYFNQFYDRFSIGAFEWIDSFGFVFSMIIQEPKYFLIFIPFILLNYLFFILLKRIFKQKSEYVGGNVIVKIALSLVFLFFIFVGIRGRIEKKSPIRVGTAYFSDHSFLNKLGLNPAFTFMRSYLDSKDKRNTSVTFMDEKIAIDKVQMYLNIDKPKLSSPIARYVEPDSVSSIKPNVVFVIMESMSAAKMGRYGDENNLTPFLDSLTKESICFDNYYTAGKHTHNGIFSTLFSFPALYRQHSMKQMKLYDGISSNLSGLGYSTTYVTTHDSQFDNVEGFLRDNNFKNIISQKDYPTDEVKTSLGVPDDYMFRNSIKVINKMAVDKKPFFITMMTASDHGPYYIPDYFHPKAKNVKQQIIEYADWSLRKFITLSSKEKWFDNTIFVFTADHGAALNASYDIPLNYFHSPLMFYAPKILGQKKIIKKIGSQIDVYPTLMGFLKQPYINNSLGIDLMHEDRKYAIINDDDKIGILDTSYFCIMKRNSQLELYKYKERDKQNYFNINKEKALDMSEFAKVHMQVFQNMILKGETRLKN